MVTAQMKNKNVTDTCIVENDINREWEQWKTNSYTMGCPPVRGDNPPALARGLSYVQVDKYGITILTTCISLDLAHLEKFRALVGKGCKIVEN